jgi:antitoxin ParD1/3/4
MAESPAEKISITITPAMKRALEGRVASGEFASASELMREAFRVWLKQQEKHEQRLAAIRLSVQEFNENPGQMQEVLKELLKTIKTRKKR